MLLIFEISTMSNSKHTLEKEIESIRHFVRRQSLVRDTKKKNRPVYAGYGDLLT